MTPEQSRKKTKTVSRYQVIKEIASGTYGTVFSGKDTLTDRPVVIKKIKDVFDSLSTAKDILREIMLLRMLKDHPNIIQLLHIEMPSDPDNFNEIELVFEMCDTDLHKIIYSDQNTTTEHIQFFIYQLLCGLNAIESAQVIHRDIKPANLLINADCTLKICDFGLSRVNGIPERLIPEIKASNFNQGFKPFQICHSNNSSSAQNSNSNSNSNSNANTVIPSTELPPPPPLLRTLTRHVVTRWYRAPEVMHSPGHYGTPVDMWSVGCVLGEILSMQKYSKENRRQRHPLLPGHSGFPFSINTQEDNLNENDQLNLIFDLIGTPTPEDLNCIQNPNNRTYFAKLTRKNPVNLQKKFPDADPDALDFLQRCLVFNPQKRMTVDQALQHPFVSFQLNASATRDPQPISPEDKASLLQYYRFEIELEERSQNANRADSQSSEEKETARDARKLIYELIRKLMVEEIQRYHKTQAAEEDSEEEKIAAEDNAPDLSTSPTLSTFSPSSSSVSSLPLPTSNVSPFTVLSHSLFSPAGKTTERPTTSGLTLPKAPAANPPPNKRKARMMTTSK